MMNASLALIRVRGRRIFLPSPEKPVAGHDFAIPVAQQAAECHALS